MKKRKKYVDGLMCKWYKIIYEMEGCNIKYENINKLFNFIDVTDNYILLKKKEEVEVRNNAESLVYNCQKTVDELGDKISSEEKAKAETEIANVKKALEGSDVEAIKSATEKLTTVFYSMSEKLYAQAAGANQAGAQENNQNAEEPHADENGNVYNADYKVDEEDKKDDKK